jgi:hypothetical protein
VEAVSGATLELIEMPDGRRFVVKQLSAEGDFLTQVTSGRTRLRRMWTSGLLDRVATIVDHTIIDVRDVDGRDVVIMRDATRDLLPTKVPVARGTSRDVLALLAAMHRAFAEEPVDNLCPIEARYAMAAPAFHASYTGANPHPMARSIVEGWQLFAERVDADVADTVFTVHREPSRLGDRLRRFPTTLLHGDPKLENLGIAGDRLVAIDWGELTGFGPREIDVAWYAHKGCVRIGCTPDEVFSDYDATSSEPLNPEAVDLACVGALAQMGFRLGVGAFASGPEPPPVALAQLEWWTARVRTALDRIGSI